MARPETNSREERRTLSETVEYREADDKASIGGYAAVFNHETVIGDWFREQIAPGAFDAAVKTDDVRALFNHDPNYVLGRTTNGTLTLGVDKKGLRYDVELNMDDPDAQRVRAKIKRGDVDGSSFGFIVEEDDWDESEMKKGKLPLRTIRKASLFDVSPVTFPAYPQASVSARSKAESMAETAEQMRAKAEAAKPEHVKARESYRAAIEAAR